MQTLLAAVQYMCEELRGPMTMAIQGGEVMYANHEMMLLAWHESYHGAGTHFVITPRALGSAYWGSGQNMAWLMAHEYAHHTLYYPVGQEEERADAVATKCMNYNALTGY